jgi:hypothetical protein
LPSGDVPAIYQRLLPKINRSKSWITMRPGFGDDADVDAQATPPEHLPFRERETNPELVTTVKALFDYPYDDLSAEHIRWLQERSSAAEKAGGTSYWDHILDECGIEASVANRVAMASYVSFKKSEDRKPAENKAGASATRRRILCMAGVSRPEGCSSS